MSTKEIVTEELIEDGAREENAKLVNESASKSKGPKMILEITEYGLGNSVVDASRTHSASGARLIQES